MLFLFAMIAALLSCRKEQVAVVQDSCNCLMESMLDNYGKRTRYLYQGERLASIEEIDDRQRVLTRCTLKYDASGHLVEEFVEEFDQGAYRRYLYEFEGDRLVSASSSYGRSAGATVLRLRLAFTYEGQDRPVNFQVFNGDGALLKKVNLYYDDAGNTSRRVEEFFDRAGELTQIFTTTYQYDGNCNAYRNFPSQLPVNASSVLYPPPKNNLLYQERYEQTIQQGAPAIYIEEYELEYNEEGCLSSKKRKGGVFSETYSYD